MGVLTLLDSKMGVPEAVLQKVGSLPDIGSMSKDDLAVLCKKLYEQSCSVFGEKFDVEYQVKKKDMEIHNLEMETIESHGTFKIPKLKKVNKFKMMELRRRRRSKLFHPSAFQNLFHWKIYDSSWSPRTMSSSSHPLDLKSFD